MIAAVCNENFTGCINCDFTWKPEVSIVRRTVCAELSVICSITVQYLDAVIITVCNENFTGCINCDTFWIIKLSIGIASYSISDCAYICSITVKYLDAVI